MLNDKGPEGDDSVVASFLDWIGRGGDSFEGRERLWKLGGRDGEGERNCRHCVRCFMLLLLLLLGEVLGV